MSSAPHSPEFVKMVQLAKTRIREISVAEVEQMQKQGKDFFLVDVREDDEWKGGHASGAIHLGKGVIERDIEKVVPTKDATLVLYCGGGYRSALAAESIQKMGYGNVLSMEGGIKAWRERKLPESQD